MKFEHKKDNKLSIIMDNGIRITAISIFLNNLILSEHCQKSGTWFWITVEESNDCKCSFICMLKESGSSLNILNNV